MSTIYLSSPTSSPPNPLLNSSSNQYSLSNTDDRDHPMMIYTSAALLLLPNKRSSINCKIST
ncbi:hypothetical protein LINPERHAP1_LOCUS34598 [Linum perenne]